MVSRASILRYAASPLLRMGEMRGLFQQPVSGSVSAGVAPSPPQRHGDHPRHRDAYARDEAGPHARHVAQHEDGEDD